jgi:hypothetical protein
VAPLAAQSTIDKLYFLPKSVVTVAGAVTAQKAFTNNGLVDANEPGPATVAIGAVADPSAYFYYKADSKLLSKNSISLELSAGGIVSGVNGVSVDMQKGVSPACEVKRCP